MSGELWFDITDFAPDRHETIPPENAALYRHINFMIHLLWETPYSTVHGPVADLCARMKANVTRPDWPTEFQKAQAVMPESLDDIAALYSATLGTTVAQLFIEDARGKDERDPALDRYAIIEHCVALRGALAAAGLSICLPFIACQGDRRDGPVGPLVDAYLMEKHAPGLGSFTMKDLYIRPYREMGAEARAALRFYKNNGVFYAPRTQSSNGGDEKHGNNWRCDPNTLKCYPQLTYFCVEDAQGNCSPMSG